ncbi:MAG: helix-turn-helix domain-containing protein, partial [Dehalococcoidia bacterium]|nr:helix-turn-helix domain-containing protein [Dehalococcoidia bacterium]
MDFTDMCPRYLAAMSFLSKKWTGLILRPLMEGPRRFTEMPAYVSGLSDRLLSQRLQGLEEAGIVERRVYPQRPVLVECSLSTQGRVLRGVVKTIQHWSDECSRTDATSKSQSEISTT